MLHRTCQVCGKEFPTQPSWIARSANKGKYCSRACAKHATPLRRVHLVCGHCGKTFEHFPSMRHQKYCSVTCRRAAEHRGPCVCQYCGLSFSSKRGPRRYCSRECYRAACYARQPDTIVALAHKVRELRQGRRISARQLASKLGVSFGTISRLETGRRTYVTPQDIQKLAAALGVPEDELWQVIPGGKQNTRYIPIDSPEEPHLASDATSAHPGDTAGPQP